MKKLEKYTGKKTYMFPNGELGMPERMQQDFPAVLAFAHVIETDEAGEVCFAVMNLNAMKSLYEIPIETPEDESIALLEAKINEPPPEVVEQNELINELEQHRADLDYLSIMTGVEL